MIEHRSSKCASKARVNSDQEFVTARSMLLLCEVFSPAVINPQGQAKRSSISAFRRDNSMCYPLAQGLFHPTTTWSRDHTNLAENTVMVLILYSRSYIAHPSMLRTIASANWRQSEAS